MAVLVIMTTIKLMQEMMFTLSIISTECVHTKHVIEQELVVKLSESELQAQKVPFKSRKARNGLQLKEKCYSGIHKLFSLPQLTKIPKVF